MTVSELISELNCYDDNMEVVFKPENTNYVEAIREEDWKVKSVNKFYGDSDNRFLIITSDGQIGAEI